MAKSKKMRRIIKGARMGKAEAMYRLGLCYQLGRERTQDLCEAAFWIGEAAEMGYAPAVEWMKDYAFDDDARVQGEA